MAADEKLPKHELLLKMLKMTTSDNDGQALVAIRKANALMESAGWDWDRLFAGKITVVADPFASISTPKARQGDGPSYRSGEAPPRPAPPRPTRPGDYGTAFRPPPPPQAPHTGFMANTPPPPTLPLSTTKNMYPGFCYVCGNHTPSQDGFAFQPHQHNHRAPTKWAVLCKTHNKSTTFIGNSPAKPIRASIDTFGLGPSDLGAL